MTTPDRPNAEEVALNERWRCRYYYDGKPSGDPAWFEFEGDFTELLDIFAGIRANHEIYRIHMERWSPIKFIENDKLKIAIIEREQPTPFS